MIIWGEGKKSSDFGFLFSIFTLTIPVLIALKRVLLLAELNLARCPLKMLINRTPENIIAIFIDAHCQNQKPYKRRVKISATYKLVSANPPATRAQML